MPKSQLPPPLEAIDERSPAVTALVLALHYIRRLPEGVEWGLNLTEDNVPTYRGSLDIIVHSKEQFWKAALALHRIPAEAKSFVTYEGALATALYLEE